MNTTRVEKFDELHRIIQGNNQETTVYRGVKNSAYELVPKIGRADFNWKGNSGENNILNAEKFMLKLFKQRSLPFLSFQPRNDWEWLAQAQHYGLPTRLLDWSRNPLVAAYFAVNEESKTDSAIYVLKTRKEPVRSEDESKSPFDYGEIRKFIPAHFNERIIAQSGLFTIHPDPTEPMSGNEIEKIIIVNSFRKELKDTLFKYDVHTASIFPGLDGLAAHISWLRSDSY